MADVLSRPLIGLVAGVLVGALAVVAIASKPNISSVDPDSSGKAMTSAWERHLVTTWLVDFAYLRTLDSGGQLNGTAFEAQDGSKRIRQTLGSVRVELDGTLYLCSASTDSRSTLSCRSNGALAPVQQRNDEEVRRIASLVNGEQRSYDVVSRASCFDLVLRPLGSPVWGSSASFCFDPATGAMTLSETRRVGGTDRYSATNVQATVPPETFGLPAPLE